MIEERDLCRSCDDAIARDVYEDLQKGQGWQPIDDAPQDGRVVFVGCWRGEVWVARAARFIWNDAEESGWWADLNIWNADQLKPEYQPTHYIPMPEPPKWTE